MAPGVFLARVQLRDRCVSALGFFIRNFLLGSSVTCVLRLRLGRSLQWAVGVCAGGSRVVLGTGSTSYDVSNVPAPATSSLDVQPNWAAAVAEAFPRELGFPRRQSAAACSFFPVWVSWTSYQHLCSHCLPRCSFCKKFVCGIFGTMESPLIKFRNICLSLFCMGWDNPLLA